MEPYGAIARGLVLTALAILWTLLLVRIIGLRAFSKMTAFDFVTTIATGSLIAQAGTRADAAEFVQALAAIAGIFAVQWLLAKGRQRWSGLRKVIGNNPVLLMEHGRFLTDAMAATRVSRSNLIEKLRAANVADPSQVTAAVLETTGDLSIITARPLDECLLEGVERR